MKSKASQWTPSQATVYETTRPLHCKSVTPQTNPGALFCMASELCDHCKVPRRSRRHTQSHLRNKVKIENVTGLLFAYTLFLPVG